ncbi:BRCA1-associated protein, partial [Tanacetum coccineum]
VRVQSDAAGRLVISGQSKQPENPWGVGVTVGISVRDAKALCPHHVIVPYNLKPIISEIQIAHCDYSFQCPCITKWTYLSCQDVEGHAIQHYRHADHCYSLELETQQIWDYVGDKSVHQLNQSKVGSKSTVTHHQCVSSEGECGDKEDEEFGGVLFSSKVDTIMDEYNFQKNHLFSKV